MWAACMTKAVGRVQQTAGATASQELAGSNPRSVTIHCTALGELLNLPVSQFHHLQGWANAKLGERIGVFRGLIKESWSD